jgi:hypothetical protein
MGNFRTSVLGNVAFSLINLLHCLVGVLLGTLMYSSRNRVIYDIILYHYFGMNPVSVLLYYILLIQYGGSTTSTWSTFPESRRQSLRYGIKPPPGRADLPGIAAFGLKAGPINNPRDDLAELLFTRVGFGPRIFSA